MAAYDLEEQEQLAEIKAWWKQHGNLLMNVLTAAALAVLAWQGWNWYQRSQAGQASQVYHVLSVAVQDQDSQRIKRQQQALAVGRVAARGADKAKDQADNEIDENEHPVFLAPGAPFEHGILFQDRQIPIHTNFLSMAITR